MERLNDIFKSNRTPSRRPLSEQTARIGGYSRAYQPERQRSPLPQSPMPTAPANRPPLARHPNNDSRYHGDAHQPTSRADVHYTWQTESDDEETSSIRYGDWESDIYDMPVPPVPPAPPVPQAPPMPQARQHEQEMHPPMSRGENRITQAYPQRSFTTRELRSPVNQEEPIVPAQYAPVMRQSAPQASQASHASMSQSRLPAPSLPPSQPAQRPMSSIQRVTQPLNYPPRSERIEPQSIPAPYSNPKTICPICKGKGYLRADVPFGHPNFGRPIACECKEQERRERRRLELETISNLGDLKDKSFENFNVYVSPGVQKAFQIARHYAEEPSGWLIFIGRVGCGKTHLAAAIANIALARGSRVLFSTVSDLLDHLRATFAPNATEVYDHLFQEMREAEVLVLDDLGAHHSSSWANEKLFQLLNYRYNSCFPTVITSNNTGLLGIDERICSRIMDTSLVTRITFDQADDYRLRNPNRA